MSLLKLRNGVNTPIIDIKCELPWCQACGNNRATVPVDIGVNSYDLCVRCCVKAGLR